MNIEIYVLVKNRALGHTTSIEDGQVQAHHIIQDAWAKENNPRIFEES